MSDESEIRLHYSDDSDGDEENQLIIDEPILSEEEESQEKPTIQPSAGFVISEVRSLNDNEKAPVQRIKLVSLDLLKDNSITEQPTLVKKRKLTETEEFVPPEELFMEDETNFMVDIKPTQLTEQMPPIPKSSRRKSRQKPMESEYTFLEPAPGPSTSRVVDNSMDAFENGNIMSNSYDLYSNKETIRRIAFMRVEANYLLSCLGKRQITFQTVVPDL